MNVAPYPFDRWPKVSAHEAALLRTALRAVPRCDIEVSLRVASELVGARVEVEASQVRSVERETLERELAAPIVALVLESARTEHALLLDVSPDLAINLVDRLLGGTGGATLGGTATLDATSRGVLGYLAARLLAESDTEWGLRVVTVDARRAIAMLLPGPLLSGTWTVRVGDDVGRVRAWLTPPLVATGALTRSAETSPLLATEVVLCADAGHAWLSVRDIKALGHGDTVMLDRTGLARDDDGWHGRVALHVNGAHRTRWDAALRGEGLTIEARRSSKELAMSNGTNEERGRDPVELAGDAPIEVSVEIARFTLPLEELAALRAGEVLRTGRPIGQEVALRAGGRVIARAELVEIEGEVGARIL